MEGPKYGFLVYSKQSAIPGDSNHRIATSSQELCSFVEYKVNLLRQQTKIYDGMMSSIVDSPHLLYLFVLLQNIGLVNAKCIGPET